MIENFEQALEWLTTLHRFGIKLGLEQTRKLCDLCGSPDRDLRFVHLAGTNGKGSTGAMLERALFENNAISGFYSSPHLLTACERIRINGRAVSEDEFAAAAETVRQAGVIMQQDSMSITYFEATTVMAMLIFKAHKCDWVVWETGMGGRLDSTNIVTPQISVITNIALDHEKFLGSTIKDIAGEKAGIVKAGVPVVCGDMPTEALEVIRERAGNVNAPFYVAAELMKPGRAAIQKVNYQSFECGGSTVELTMNGVMQQRNATLACAVLEIIGLWNAQSRNALKNTRWPARIEVLENGRIILDGGHNPDGLQALVETLKVLYPGRKFRWIFGAFADKDYSSGLKIIAPLAEELFAVGFAEESRLSAAREDVCKTAAACMISKTSPVDDLAGLLKNIKNGNADLPVIIAGSLYLAGEVLNLLGAEERVINLH